MKHSLAKIEEVVAAITIALDGVDCGMGVIWLHGYYDEEALTKVAVAAIEAAEKPYLLEEPK